MFKKTLAFLFLPSFLLAQVGTPSVSITTSGGGSSNGVSVSSGLCSNVTTFTTVGTSEEVAASCPLTAGFLAANGQSISFVAGGTCANNANAKVVRVYLGASLILQTVGAATCSAANTWRLNGELLRVTATTQVGGGQFSTAANTGLGERRTQGETLANALNVELRFLTATAAGDLTMNYFQVKTP